MPLRAAPPKQNFIKETNLLVGRWEKTMFSYGGEWEEISDVTLTNSAVVVV
jgi:hypothetical protein